MNGEESHKPPKVAVTGQYNTLGGRCYPPSSAHMHEITSFTGATVINWRVRMVSGWLWHHTHGLPEQFSAELPSS